MVTHIPSPTSSLSSLPLGGRPHNEYRSTPPYACSQAGSMSAARRPSATPYHADRPRSSSTISSQSTLVPRSVAGYPTPHPTFSAAPSAYKAPSAASTSAARPRQGHRTISRSRRSREVEQELTNVFPWFGQTGDLEICLRDRSGRTERRYLLHRLILAQTSRWFEGSVMRVGKESPRRDSARLRGSGAGVAYDPRSEWGEVGQRMWYELDWR